MDELERRTMVAALLRCSGQFARPPGMSRSTEQLAMARGLLKFHEWPSGHYEITAAGRSLISEYGD